MSRRRTLHPEERDIWQQVARTARALPGRDKPLKQPSRDTSGAPVAPPPRALVHAPLPPDFTIGQRSSGGPDHDLARPMAEALKSAPVAMDKRQFMRLSRGQLAPEARIDLHGMTLAQAQGALTGFIANAWTRGLRLVLVITGKGRREVDTGPIPRRTGALRHEVPHWLRRAPLGPMVLDIRPAHRRHGGDGALYVYLRRRR